ncbi:uncharacterized protein [Apostichopus japonicus]|uniref:uncharacterized protein n=1 Tax=Stichopus japonicus TaxID=307972 RepID=UPI003AB22F7C
MAAVTPRSRTHEEIQQDLQNINPEIPLEHLRQSLEEHNYDISRVQQDLLQENSERNQPPKLNPNINSHMYNMDRHSVSPQPSTQRQSRSVSEDNSMRGMHKAPQGLSTGGCKTNRPGHMRSHTWDQDTQLNYTSSPLTRSTAGGLHVNTNLEVAQARSPQHSPRSDVGVWLPPMLHPRQKYVATLNLSNADHGNLTESSNHSLMTTQQISPITAQQKSHIRTSPSAEVSHTSSLLPWTLSKPSKPWVHPCEDENCPVQNTQANSPHSLQPLNVRREAIGAIDWSKVPKSPPTVITSISSPVAPPVVSITTPDATDRPVEVPDEPTNSESPKNNIGSELKKQTRLQALLAHQKARFGLIKRRVEETKIKTDAMRKEVADMEKDLDRRRAQTPASSFASPEAISGLQERKRGLQIDVECLQRDIHLTHAKQRELLNQDSFNFYNNMATEPSQHPVYRGLLLPEPQNTSSPVESEINKQWSCHACSFKNHEYMPACEMCGRPRAESITSPTSGQS